MIFIIFLRLYFYTDYQRFETTLYCYVDHYFIVTYLKFLWTITPADHECLENSQYIFFRRNVFLWHPFMKKNIDVLYVYRKRGIRNLTYISSLSASIVGFLLSISIAFCRNSRYALAVSFRNCHSQSTAMAIFYASLLEFNIRGDAEAVLARKQKYIWHDGSKCWNTFLSYILCVFVFCSSCSI